MFNRVLMVAALCCGGFIGGFMFLGGGGTVANEAPTVVVEEGIPNLCEQAVESATLRVVGTGHTLSAHQEVTGAQVNESGTCDVNFVRRMHSPITEARFFWNGEEVISVPGPTVIGIGHIYTYTMELDTEGSPTVGVETERQMWWYGEKLGYQHLSTGDAYFSPECIAASQDPAYLALYKPGTGPACVAHTYEKQCTIDPETNEEHCPVVVVD